MMTGFKPDGNAAKDSLGHFATAFVFLLSGLATLLWNSSRIVEGQYADARVVGGLHWLTLGWLSISIFGALRVFSGVALGSSAHHRWLSGVVWFCWSLGAVLFPVGLMMFLPKLIMGGITLIFIALVFFSIHFIPVLWKASRGTLTRVYLCVALLSLWCVFWLGAGAGFLRAGWVAWPLPEGYFQAHLLVALFGWVGSTVVGVGSHLIPMFALSNNPKQWAVKSALPFWVCIPFCATIGAFYPNPFLWIGWSVAGIGSLLWGIQVYFYFDTKLRKEKDWGLFMAGGATVWLVVSWPILWFVENIGHGSKIGVVGIFLVCWLTLFTLGIYHRVVPFLVWFQRFANKMGKEPVPRVKDMIHNRLAFLTTCFALIGAVIWVCGLFGKNTTLAWIGSACILCAGLGALGQLRFLYQPLPAPVKGMGVSPK